MAWFLVAPAHGRRMLAHLELVEAADEAEVAAAFYDRCVIVPCAAYGQPDREAADAQEHAPGPIGEEAHADNPLI